MQKRSISERRTCLINGIARRTKRYPALHKPEDVYITERLGILASKWKRFGYRRLQVMLKREGIIVNHKKVYRLYQEAGLSLKKKHRKKSYLKRGMPARPQEMAANERWSMAFVSDKTSSGRKSGCLRYWTKSPKSVWLLKRLVQSLEAPLGDFWIKPVLFRGYPQELLSDNGSEFYQQGHEHLGL